MSIIHMLKVGAVFIALALAGCTSEFKDITVATEASPTIDFDGYRSYAWAAAAAIVRDPERQWTPTNLDIGGEIMFLVDRELRARGMTAAAHSPDVLVIYAVGVDMKALDVVVDPDDQTERFAQVPKGGLMIILADPDSRRVMWVGGALADLAEEPTVELQKKRLDYAITTMFKKFPH